MFKRTFLLLFTLLFTIFAGIACSSKDDENDTQNNAVEEEAENEESNTDDGDEINSDEDTEQQEDSTTEANEETTNTKASEPSLNGSAELPETIEINEEIITDTGLIFILEKISFEEDHIAVDFHAENHSGFPKYLAAGGVAYDKDLGGVTLIDDTGFPYRFVAKTGDSMLEVNDQETVDATIRFLGRVRNDAKTITLIFNPDEEEDSDGTPIFKFEDIEIPW